MAENNGKKLVLSRDTLLPIGAVIAIVGTLLVLSWQARGALAEIQKDISERPTREEVQKMLGADASWEDNMRTWIRVFRAQEPTLKIPDTR